MAVWTVHSQLHRINFPTWNGLDRKSCTTALRGREKKWMSLFPAAHFNTCQSIKHHYSTPTTASVWEVIISPVQLFSESNEWEILIKNIPRSFPRTFRRFQNVPKISCPVPPKNFMFFCVSALLLYFSFLVTCNIFLERERFKAAEPHFCFVPRGGRFVHS